MPRKKQEPKGKANRTEVLKVDHQAVRLLEQAADKLTQYVGRQPQGYLKRVAHVAQVEVNSLLQEERKGFTD